MQVSYRINLADIIRANFYMLPRSKTYRIFAVLLVVALGYLSFYLASAPNLTSVIQQIGIFALTFLLSLAISVVILVAVLIVMPSIGFLLDAKEQSRECTLTTTENGIKLETTVSRSDMFWSQIKQIEQTSRYLYFFIAGGGTIIIPLRTFDQPGAGTQFYEKIKALWEANKNNPHE